MLSLETLQRSTSLDIDTIEDASIKTIEEIIEKAKQIQEESKKAATVQKQAEETTQKAAESPSTSTVV